MLMINLLVFCYAYFEVNRLWGEYTRKVSPDEFKTAPIQVVISHVNLLSADGNEMIPNQSVVIQNGMIIAMGDEVNVPEGFEKIDGRGKFLIPGLIDSHVHLWQSPNDLLLYLANGVTHVKEMNGSETHLQWKDEIEHGRPGPDLFVASRRHNSSGLFKGWFGRLTAKINPVNDSTDIEADLLALADLGFDAIKVYTFLEKDHFMAFNETARKHDIKLVGHTPVSMTLDEVWGTELRELGHVEEIVKALIREFGGYNDTNAEDFLAHVKTRSTDIVNQLLHHDIKVQTTLSLMETIAPIRDDLDGVLKNVALPFVNPGISESTHPSIPVLGWLPNVNIYRAPADMNENQKRGDQIFWKTYAEAHRFLIREMAEKGVHLLAATDANVPVMVPGFSIHQELLALKSAGLSNAQVLKAATQHPARAMGVNTGQIKVGYQADLLLLNANPLVDIKNTQTIATVVSNGRVYDRQSLDLMLTAVKAANDHSRSVDISHFH